MIPTPEAAERARCGETSPSLRLRTPGHFSTNFLEVFSRFATGSAPHHSDLT